MGTADRLHGLTVYLDANILIYVVEGLFGFGAVVYDITRAIAGSDFHAVTSELSLAEVLVVPFRTGNDEDEATYMTMLSGRETIRVQPVESGILLDAARVRAETGSRLPDAIHLATARATRCDVFLTNDIRLRAPADVTIVTLAELAAL